MIQKCLSSSGSKVISLLKETHPQNVRAASPPTLGSSLIKLFINSPDSYFAMLPKLNENRWQRSRPAPFVSDWRCNGFRYSFFSAFSFSFSHYFSASHFYPFAIIVVKMIVLRPPSTFVFLTLARNGPGLRGVGDSAAPGNDA